MDLEEVSLLPADFSIEWNVAEGLFINSNLNQLKEQTIGNRKFVYQTAKSTKEVQFHINSKKYKSILINGLTINTDLKRSYG